MKRKLIVGALAGLSLVAPAAVSPQTGAGSAAPATQVLRQRIEQYLRTLYAWGPAFTVAVDPPEPSPVPGLLRVQVTVSYQGQSERAALLVSQDGRYLVRGQLDDMLADPFASNRTRLASSADPATGPAQACVSVVEFSDYQCPHCREAFPIVEKLHGVYPGVRFVFKDFPITQIHPWAMTAALAARCVYRQKPEAFAAFQRAVFDAQDTITADNAWDQLTKLAQQAGADAQALHACMSDPATQRVIEQDVEEGKQLGVTSTPTFFVNGRPLAGIDEGLLEQYIGYELSRCAAPQM
jgi:protein-disulfide isomerase